MTIICYDGKELVADGLVNSDGFIVCTNEQKILDIQGGDYKGGYFAGCGVTSDLFKVIDYLEVGGKPKFSNEFMAFINPPRKHPDHKMGKIWLLDNELSPVVSGEPNAIGSGSILAIAYMRDGLSAYETVKRVCKHYIQCGGKIQRVKV